MERIRAIEREYRVALIAADGLDERFRADPSVLDAEELKRADYRNFRENLEATYLIRLFAEFEAGLREAWELAFRRTTVPSVRDLIESLHAQRLLPDVWRDCVHNIRIYRNVLVHEGGGDAQPIGLREACSDFCRFFSGLPHHW
jgi:hypothetical protein